MNATLTRITDIGTLADEWRELETNADASFFISWSWIGPWLHMALSAHVELYLYRCQQCNETIALGLLSRATVTRRKLFRTTILALNEVRLNNLDMIIEYNDLLIRRSFEQEVRARFINDLLSSPIKWDELMLSGIAETGWQEIAAGNTSLTPIIDEQRQPWSTDISAIDGDLDKLLAPLSSNRRWQIRRSFKAFREDGELQIAAANNYAEALAFFDDMGRLHTARWNRAGKAGSFANPSWVSFHRSVISESFERREIQLLKISAGEKAIGYVYSFIWRGTAYMLQTGFTHDDTNTRRPGFVSHCLAMQYNSTRRIDTYDYMCGDAEYKRILGVEQKPLVWGRHQKSKIKFLAENLLVRVMRHVRNRNNQ